MHDRECSADHAAQSPAWNVVAGVLAVVYPVIVYLGLTRWSTRTVALGLLCLLLPLVAIRLRRRDAAAVRGLALIPLLTVVALALGAALNAGGFVLAVPVAINAVLLVAFGTTLRVDAMPMIERFARLVEPDLSEAKRRWCRTWTVIWCVFFACNGGIALTLALAAPLAWWTVYNGLLAYALMGLLFATEWVGRRWRFGGDAAQGALVWDERAAEAGPASRRPSVDGASPGGAARDFARCFHTHIPADWPAFRGHFPGSPVLAGAVQLQDLVMPCIARVRPGLAAPTRLAGVKFLLRIDPGDELDVTLRWQAGSAAVDFDISRAGACCTTGRVGFASAADRAP